MGGGSPDRVVPVTGLYERSRLLSRRCNSGPNRAISGLTGVITTIAGNGTQGSGGDGGAATSATLNPYDIAVDSSNNVFIADYGGNRVRVVASATGVISTYAGSGAFGYSGDGGPATAATMQSPSAVAVDCAGNIYFTDTNNGRIRFVNAVTHVISTIAGGGSPGDGLGDGGAATAAALGFPQGVAVDASGNVLIGDTGHNRVRLVAAPSPIVCLTATPTPTPSATSPPTPSPPLSASGTGTPSPFASAAAASGTGSTTPAGSTYASGSATPPASSTPRPAESPSGSRSHSCSRTRSHTATRSGTVSRSGSRSVTHTRSASRRPSVSNSVEHSASRSRKAKL